MGTAWNYCRADLPGVYSKHDAPLLSFPSLSEIQVCILGKKVMSARIFSWQRERFRFSPAFVGQIFSSNELV